LTHSVRVTITGLDRSDINYLSPKPQFSSVYAIGYDPLEWETDSSNMLKRIEFQMRDREIGYLADYKIFIYGILLGVFASLFASIVWSVIRDYEKNNEKKT
jgi:hypothetical protein